MVVSMTCPSCSGYVSADLDTVPGLNSISLDSAVLQCSSCGIKYNLKLKVVKNNERGHEGRRLPMCYARRKEQHDEGNGYDNR